VAAGGGKGGDKGATDVRPWRSTENAERFLLSKRLREAGIRGADLGRKFAALAEWGRVGWGTGVGSRERWMGVGGR
jgi:hypothetical protein